MKKYRLIFSLFIQVTFSCALFSQNESPSKPLDNVLPGSPNAASLGVFGGVPVGHYTGIPNISIPIYEIELDGKIILINLSYHASGIRVNQESSWVGLGWTLNAGGIITRQVQGSIDFNQYGPNQFIRGYYTNSTLPNYFAYAEDFNQLPYDMRNYFIYNLPYDDIEPDLYNFSFGSNSGVFYTGNKDMSGNSLYLAKGIIRNSTEYLDITYDILQETWNVTDGLGYIYYFSTTEKTTTYSKNVSEYPNHAKYLDRFAYKRYINKEVPDREEIMGGANIAFLNEISSWLLDSIKSPQNNIVKFIYKINKDNIISPISFSEHNKYDVNSLIVEINPNDTPNGTIFDKFFKTNYNVSVTEQAILEKIIFDKGEVIFESLPDRKDIEITNDPSLYQTKFPEVASTGKRLNNIKIKNKAGEIIKSINLFHSYIGNINSNYTCRLLLDILSRIINRNISLNIIEDFYPQSIRSKLIILDFIMERSLIYHKQALIVIQYLLFNFKKIVLRAILLMVKIEIQTQ